MTIPTPETAAAELGGGDSAGTHRAGANPRTHRSAR